MCRTQVATERAYGEELNTIVSQIKKGGAAAAAAAHALA
jgi:hypothetical protein